MNPTDKFEQIQIYKRLNPVEQEAMVLCHEQQIKDLAEHLLELKQSMEFNKEKKEWVGLTDAEATELWENIDNCDSWKLIMQVLIMQVQKKLQEKNK